MSQINIYRCSSCFRYTTNCLSNCWCKHFVHPHLNGQVASLFRTRPSVTYPCLQLLLMEQNKIYIWIFFIFLFCTMTNKSTITSQIITLLHASALSCYPQGACVQYLAKLYISNAVVGNTIYNYDVSHRFNASSHLIVVEISKL